MGDGVTALKSDWFVILIFCTQALALDSPFWSLNLIQIIDHHLFTGLLLSGKCSVFRQLEKESDDFFERSNVDLLADQFVLVHPLLRMVAAPQVHTQLQILEQDWLVDFVLPCSVFLAFDYVIKCIQRWFLFANFDELWSNKNVTSNG